MVEDLRLKIDGEDAFDQRERTVHTTVAPSEIHVILQTEDSSLLSVFRLANGIIKVVLECINEALSSGGTSGTQSLPESEGE